MHDHKWKFYEYENILECQVCKDVLDIYVGIERLNGYEAEVRRLWDIADADAANLEGPSVYHER